MIRRGFCTPLNTLPLSGRFSWSSVTWETKMRVLAGFVVTLALLVWGRTSSAAPIIFDNGSPNQDTAIGSELFKQQTAENFSLVTGSTTVTGVNWWGVYGNAATPPPADDFIVAFFNDAAGQPEPTPFLGFHLGDVGRTATGQSLSGFPQFEIFAYSASISPTAFLPGVTYWVALLNDTTADLDDDWFWATSSFLGIHAFRQGATVVWSVSPSDLAFNLTGEAEPIPEPATVLLIGTGLVAVRIRRYRANRRK